VHIGDELQHFARPCLDELPVGAQRHAYDLSTGSRDQRGLSLPAGLFQRFGRDARQRGDDQLSTFLSDHEDTTERETDHAVLGRVGDREPGLQLLAEAVPAGRAISTG